MQSRQLWFALSILACGAGAGLAYHALFGSGRPGAALLYGLVMSGCLMAVERGWVFGRLHARIRRLPPLLYVPVAEATYVAAIAAGNALGGLLVWALRLTDDPLAEAVVLTPRVLAYSVAVSVVLVFVVRVRDLIGHDAFVSLLIGRYHRPVREARVFLFIDVVGSTAYAEAHGDLRAQGYLGAIFAALAEPVRRHRGSTDDYVGDMMMVTWPLTRGLKDARCVACVFAALDAIEAEAAAWARDFGQVPRLRMALHCGSVVTADVGVDRHKIAYFGDTVNATARIEALCRTLEAPVLASHALLAHLPGLPPGITARDLGPHPVRGRGQPVGVTALERAPGHPGAQTRVPPRADVPAAPAALRA